SPPFGGGRSTPSRRAFERPIAIACFGDRAPCLPSRTWWISSRTNSPACVDADFPSAFLRRARSRVFFSGMASLPPLGSLAWAARTFVRRVRLARRARAEPMHVRGPGAEPPRTRAAAGSAADQELRRGEKEQPERGEQRAA